jgi:hypothetical protein
MKMQNKDGVTDTVKDYNLSQLNTDRLVIASFQAIKYNAG